MAHTSASSSSSSSAAATPVASDHQATVKAASTTVTAHYESTHPHHRIAHLALGQTAAAVIASSFVSPAMTIIDLSIIRAQFNKSSIGAALRGTTSDLMSSKMRWNPALGIMSTVYTSTYLTANYTTALCHELEIDYKIPTAVATSLVNITAIAYKDREFARMCSKAPSVFPLASYGLFAMRDGLTVTSSFVLKNTVKDHLIENHELNARNADLAASFAVPMLAQLFSTPLHILSLDIYSHPQSAFRLRMKEVAKGYMSVCSGRVMRIIPAFGVGGYLNDRVKESFVEKEGGREGEVVLLSSEEKKKA